MIHKKAIWHDRKRNFLGLPWTFTIYELTEDRLYINTGILNSREDEVRLYRITDLTLTRSLWQKITGTGTIHCDSADKTMQNFDILNVKNSIEVKEMLSDSVEQQGAGTVFTPERAWTAARAMVAMPMARGRSSKAPNRTRTIRMTIIDRYN
jgi:uncharacterized membrane protein YdbT with pleckstrin-like domain